MKSIKRGQLNCGGASMAFRRQQALEIGGYNEELTRGEDGLLALKLSSFGKIKMVSTSKAFIYTSNRRTLMEGNLFKSLLKRVAYGLRHMFSFITTQQIPK